MQLANPLPQMTGQCEVNLGICSVAIALASPLTSGHAKWCHSPSFDQCEHPRAVSAEQIGDRIGEETRHRAFFPHLKKLFHVDIHVKSNDSFDPRRSAPTPRIAVVRSYLVSAAGRYRKHIPIPNLDTREEDFLLFA